MFKQQFFYILIVLLPIAIPLKLGAMEEKNQVLDAFICVSSEDEKYNVKGGIGTYLGILTKEAKRLCPQMKVYWVSKSHNAFDFSEKDIYGIKRHYLSDTNPYQNRPFNNRLNFNRQESKSVLDQQIFLNKANAKLSKILSKLNGKKVAIECGEWEGIAHQLFRTLYDKNIVKATRIHTPLAVTMVSNDLPVSASNQLQLMHEFETLYNADCISSCTKYMKDQVIQHVLGSDCEKSPLIKVIPNPVDANNYKSGVCTRQNSIDKVNTILKNEFINEDTFNIYVIGSVEIRKGAELVIDAVATVAKKLPNARFCFLGHHGGNDSKNLTANTKLSPDVLLEKIPKEYRHQVAFAGYVDHSELPSIIESGDAFPIMYLGDNFPGTVAEIALMEKPILALARGGVNEMLQNENGEFVAYNLGSSLQAAPSALSAGLVYLYKNAQERKAIGKNLNALVRSKYVPEKIAKDILQFYSDTLSKKS